LACYLQNRISEVFAVDIHPAARIGKGILIDHATSVVIGETAVVDDDVSMLHEVTLGGTGKETGDRHPKVRRGVLIGAGAKILGNVVIGEGSKVAAGSVVLTNVPPHTTVAGVPAVVIGRPTTEEPSLEMDQGIGGS
jgi:serine O-acetyltransferase